MTLLDQTLFTRPAHPLSPELHRLREQTTEAGRRQIILRDDAGRALYDQLTMMLLGLPQPPVPAWDEPSESTRERRRRYTAASGGAAFFTCAVLR